ncbi:glutamine synthetase family protein [Patulibacter medicamentivorans]|uniref:Glutamine synthetase family protein n=1 Tax=Patulibacter medicamentivorans TaxID=1097667 RepID=H0E0L9_9ACTN|nr:glutamine synthetase family protein [Patulibacter medicamentivorans]EHN12753.1 glutamine synthetase family protein [Patulibacter medicamentivorans]
MSGDDPRAHALPGRLAPDQLRSLVASGEVDQVLLAFVDMQGRLQGKQLGAPYFVSDVLDHGAGACSYLLSVDVEMAPQEGLSTSSWETGHGDFSLIPDLASLRLAAWRPRTAICVADAVWPGGDPVLPSPRQILRRQVERLAERGWTASTATELEFIVHRESYAEARRRHYHDLTPVSDHNVDYSLLGLRAGAPLLDRLAAEMPRSGLALESVKGEANLGQFEINFRHSAPLDAADGHSIFKHAVKEIAAQEGVSATFMAKWDEREGNSCHLHLSLADAEGPLFARDRRTFDGFLAGQLAYTRELTLLLAPNVNSYKRFAGHSFAPTAIAWGRDNRTCALRVVGDGGSLRIEHRAPGGDVNPYLALAAMIAAGLRGIDEGLVPEPATEGNAYASSAPRLPATLDDAVAAFRASEVAAQAFGPEIVAHYARAGEIEIEAARAAVTDWERVRGYERL